MPLPPAINVGGSKRVGLKINPGHIRQIFQPEGAAVDHMGWLLPETNPTAACGADPPTGRTGQSAEIETDSSFDHLKMQDRATRVCGGRPSKEGESYQKGMTPSRVAPSSVMMLMGHYGRGCSLRCCRRSHRRHLPAHRYLQHTCQPLRGRWVCGSGSCG